MVKRRYARADIGNAFEIDIRKADAGLLAHVEQDFSPGIDDKTVSEGIAAVLVMTNLGRCNDKQPRLDRTGPKPAFVLD